MAILTTEQAVNAQQTLQKIRGQIGQAVIGQEQIIEQLLIALVAGGHVLLEGVPGLGKTLLVKALAKTFQGQHGRIQFTPDLMPSDVLGHTLFDMQTNQFITRQGPVFTNILLADEINRAPAKTQAALLEVMQEEQVTLDGKSHQLSAPFMVLATQNPIEQEGTYPLPEAQLDRFLLKILIDYPTFDEEVVLTKLVTQAHSGAKLNVTQVEPVIDIQEVLQLQTNASMVDVDERVLHYAIALVQATRQYMSLSAGAGPRGSISLIRAARARALLNGQNYLTPDDIKQVALPVLRHRVVLSAEAEIEGLKIDEVLMQIFEQVPAPRN